MLHLSQFFSTDVQEKGAQIGVRQLLPLSFLEGLHWAFFDLHPERGVPNGTFSVVRAMFLGPNSSNLVEIASSSWTPLGQGLKGVAHRFRSN